ncbi:MAG: PepSY domain-containing protein [Candidatus Udaeobacter sp.]
MKLTVTAVCALGVIAAFSVLNAGAGTPNEAQLTKEAKVTKAQAERVVLARVPNGRIKSAEIENEHGKLAWSFDITTPGTRDITEVPVDAKSGAIVTIDKETPKQQATKAKAEKQKP